MLEVIKYLNNATAVFREMQAELDYSDVPCSSLALDDLNDELGIKFSINELYPELVVLNYDQIKSPKHHPITIECRSLVLEIPSLGGEWTVVSRSFDRFFNYGETETSYNATRLVAHEKMDGSLIGLFYFAKYGWLYRTRSMIMPTSSIMGFELTWDVLIEDALGDKWFNQVEAYADEEYDNDRAFTFIMEVTSPENRVVVRYGDRGITLLAVRENSTGIYVNGGIMEEVRRNTSDLGWGNPETWEFETMADCVNGAKDLRELKEGYVMYTRLGEPACKVKNPAYVAAHHLRGEGILTPKRVMDLIIMNELDEYLSIFPEDTAVVEPYRKAIDSMWASAEGLWASCQDITDQKQFALKVKDSPVCGLLFRKKGGVGFNDAFNSLTSNGKYNLISAYVATEDTDD